MSFQSNISEIRSLVQRLDAGLNSGAGSRRVANPDVDNGFGKILHDKLLPATGRPPRGMTAPDYLANPLIRPRQPVAEEKSGTRKMELAAMKQPDENPPPPADNGQSAAAAVEPAGALKTAGKRAGNPQMARIEKSIQAAAEKYDLSPNLIRSVIRAESNFDPRAVSRAGARGLMQLMPATAEELGVTNSFDIHQNIDGGSRYLRQMLDRFDGDLKLALSAYNAGPGTVMRFGGNVPYRETQIYVQRVMDHSGITA